MSQLNARKTPALATYPASIKRMLARKTPGSSSVHPHKTFQTTTPRRQVPSVTDEIDSRLRMLEEDSEIGPHITNTRSELDSPNHARLGFSARPSPSFKTPSYKPPSTRFPAKAPVSSRLQMERQQIITSQQQQISELQQENVALNEKLIGLRHDQHAQKREFEATMASSAGVVDELRQDAARLQEKLEEKDELLDGLRAELSAEKERGLLREEEATAAANKAALERKIKDSELADLRATIDSLRAELATASKRLSVETGRAEKSSVSLKEAHMRAERAEMARNESQMAFERSQAELAVMQGRLDQQAELARAGVNKAKETNMHLTEKIAEAEARCLDFEEKMIRAKSESAQKIDQLTLRAEDAEFRLESEARARKKEAEASRAMKKMLEERIENLTKAVPQVNFEQSQLVATLRETLDKRDATIRELQAEQQELEARHKSDAEANLRIHELKLKEARHLLERANKRAEEVSTENRDLFLQLNELRNASQELENELDSLRTQKVARENTLTTQISGLMVQLREISEQAKLREDELVPALEQATQEIDLLKERAASLGHDLDAALASKASTEQTSLETNALLEKKLEEKEEIIEQLEDKLEESRSEMNLISQRTKEALEQESVRLRGELLKQVELRKELEQSTQAMDARLADLLEKNESLERLLTNSNETRELVQKENESLIRQQHALEEQARDAQTASTERMRQLEGEIQDYVKIVEKLRGEFSSLEQLHNDLQVEKSSAVEQRERLEIRLKHMNSSYEALKERLQNAKSAASDAVPQLEDDERFAEAESAFRAKSIECNQLQSQLEVVRAEAAKAREQKETLRKSVKELQVSLNETRERLEAQLAHTEEERASLAAGAEESKKAMGALQREKDSIQTKLRTDVHELQRAAAELKKRALAAERALATRNAETKEAIAQMEVEHSIHIAEQQETRQKLELQNANLTADLRRSNENIRQLRGLLAESNTARENASGETLTAIEERGRLSKQLNEMEAEYRRELTEKGKLLDALTEELSELRAQAAEANNALTDALDRERALETERNELSERLKEQTEHGDSLMQSVKAQLDETTERFEQMQRQYSESTGRLRDALAEETSINDEFVEKTKALENNLSNALQRAAAAETDAAELRRETGRLKQARDEAQDEFDRLRRTTEQSNSLLIEKSRDAEEKLEKTSREAESALSMRRELEERNSFLELEVEKAQSSVESLRARAESAEAQAQDMQARRLDEQTRSEEIIQELRKTVDVLENELDRYKSEFRNEANKTQLLDTELDNAASQLAQHEALLSLQANEHAQTLTDNEETIEQLTQHIAILQESNAQFATQLKQSQDIISLLQEQRLEAQTSNNELQNRLEEIYVHSGSAVLEPSFIDSRARIKELEIQVSTLLTENSSLSASLRSMAEATEKAQRNLNLISGAGGAHAAPSPAHAKELETENVRLAHQVEALEAELEALQERLKTSRVSFFEETQRFRSEISRMNESRHRADTASPASPARAERPRGDLAETYRQELQEKDNEIDDLRREVGRLRGADNSKELSQQLSEERTRRRSEARQFQADLLRIKERVEEETARLRSQVSSLSAQLTEARAQLNASRRGRRAPARSSRDDYRSFMSHSYTPERPQ
eukprot:gnl/Chilomastix_cuspidata/2783.p1 GENE.gnl/Chilomastix_cuspidata/2783~~gnl/Chilomastix_cuspidata/2783.p1  ORF type:complete len:1627 (-),score=620.57 gnl/Chilomastix_cuspidata/2783:772-5652(-)